MLPGHDIREEDEPEETSNWGRSTSGRAADNHDWGGFEDIPLDVEPVNASKPVRNRLGANGLQDSSAKELAALQKENAKLRETVAQLREVGPNFRNKQAMFWPARRLMRWSSAASTPVPIVSETPSQTMESL